MDEKERFSDWTYPEIENNRLTKWNWMVQSKENLELGKNVDIGAFTYMNARYGIEIQDNVQIGSHCSIYTYNSIDDKKGNIIIKENSCVGSHSVIFPGITIGKNSTIGAFSLVNKDIPDNCVAYGIPIKIIKNKDENMNEEKETFEVPLFKTYSDQEDIDAVTKILKRGTYWATGPEIQEFETKIAEYIGTRYALTFNSGTSALHTLLLTCDIKYMEVIVPSFTFIATVNSVVLAGGIPIFAETETETFGLDAEDVEKKITPRTKAIIALHYGGFPSKDIEKLRQIADKNNILLIEDAAESIGSHINQKKVGTFGHAAMFSFCQNKILPIGEGGMIVTNSQQIYEKAKLLRSHGRVEQAEDYFSNTQDNDYIQVGYNFRMPTICAALGISQLKKIQKIIDLRREKADYLTKHLKEIPEIKLLREIPGHYQTYQTYVIQLPDKETRDNLQSHLTNKRIRTKIYFNPVHLKSIYKKQYYCKEGDLPKTEQLSTRVLNLPFFPQITGQELDYIISSIKEFFKNKQGENFENERYL